ncbi:hypothetical protein, partial [Neisseria gonorrhoeae]|uniref:hypothetical protein n=1 Tax=Neisseria gonorrhoeae TaxID=485 RepID=UPI001B7F95A1
VSVTGDSGKSVSGSRFLVARRGRVISRETPGNSISCLDRQRSCMSSGGTLRFHIVHLIS